MSELTTAVVPSPEIARVLANALAFCPARSRVPAIRIRILDGCLEAMGTDTYTVGDDYVECHEVRGPGAVAEIAREDALAIEKAARADRKGIGFLSIGDGLLSFEPVEGEPVRVDLEPDPDWPFWATLEEALIPEKRFLVAFTPDYLTRFGKVKADKTNRVMDVAIDGPELPVRVKIGPTFRGLIMPVYREQHIERVDGEGLWT